MKTVIFFLFIAFVFIQCNAQVKDSNKMQKKPIEQVIKENKSMLLAIPGVQGFYQGQLDNGSDCIVIMMVDSLSKENKKQIPDSLMGYPVKVEVSGRIKPLYKNDNRSSP